MVKIVNNFSDDNKIIVALDYDDKKYALNLSEKLDPSYCRLKIGKQLLCCDEYLMENISFAEASVCSCVCVCVCVFVGWRRW